jgi:hypothetical protein
VETGSVLTWGAGSNGQLGNGTTTERQLVPVAVTGLSEATITAGGGEHGMASAVACIVPAVTRVEPTLGSPGGGTRVTITGVGLLNEAAVVKFGSASATELKAKSEAKLIVTSPPGSGTVDVTVQTPCGTSAINRPGDQFAYGPTLTKVEPVEGSPAGGTAVAITGSNLSEVKAVRFGTAAASEVKTESPTRITATSPPGSINAEVDVTVETAGGTSPTNSADRFKYNSEGPLHLYSNNVQMTTRQVGFVEWGPLKLVSETMGAEVECVNMGVGYLNNEGTPTTRHGTIESWNGQGDATAMGTEARRTCQYKQSGVSAAEAWVTDEPPLHGSTRTGPLSPSTNLEVACAEGEGHEEGLGEDRDIEFSRATSRYL